MHAVMNVLQYLTGNKGAVLTVVKHRNGGIAFGMESHEGIAKRDRSGHFPGAVALYANA